MVKFMFEEIIKLTVSQKGTAAKASVRFLTFDTIKNVMSDSSGKLSPGRGIIAGMVAGAVESVTAVTPTERLKTALSISLCYTIPKVNPNIVLGLTMRKQENGSVMASTPQRHWFRRTAFEKCIEDYYRQRSNSQEHQP